jgi:hypothetical protein
VTRSSIHVHTFSSQQRHFVCSSNLQGACVAVSSYDHQMLWQCSVRQHNSPLCASVTAVWPHYQLTCNEMSHCDEMQSSELHNSCTGTRRLANQI